jgi:hypothetical protein
LSEELCVRLLQVASGSPDARVEVAWLKSRHAIGPSWPVRTSNRRPTVEGEGRRRRGARRITGGENEKKKTEKDRVRKIDNQREEKAAKNEHSPEG